MFLDKYTYIFHLFMEKSIHKYRQKFHRVDPDKKYRSVEHSLDMLMLFCIKNFL